MESLGKAYIDLYKIENLLRSMVIFFLKNQKGWWKNFYKSRFIDDKGDSQIGFVIKRSGENYLLRHPIYETTFSDL